MIKNKKIIFFLFISLSFAIFNASDVVYCRLVRTDSFPESTSRENIHTQANQVIPLIDSSYSRSEIETARLYPAVEITIPATMGSQEDREYKALSAGEFELMVENLYQIASLTEEWKTLQQGSLSDFIILRMTSGFLKIEDISFDEKILSFKLGGLVNLRIDTENFRIQKVDGLIFMPTKDYFLEMTESMRNGLDNILMDGEANMGIDVALLHREMYYETLRMIEILPKYQIKFQRHGGEKSFEVKIAGETHTQASSSANVSEAQWIGDFQSYDNPDSFLNLMNRLYYGTFAANAFGVIDKEKTLEPACAKKSAEDFYRKIQVLDSRDKLPEIITIQEWGAGDGYSASVFLNRMKELDQENATDYYSRINYILLDYSSQVVKDLFRAPHLATHRNHTKIIQADILDSQSLQGLKPALLIRANLLLNSLPAKIVEIKDGIAHEVEARAYIDMEENETINGYTLENIKRFIQNGNIETLKSLGKEFFNRIEYVEQTKQILDLGLFLHGDYIQKLIDSQFEGKVSIDIGAKLGIENMLSVLSPEGEIQIADTGYVTSEDLDLTADLFRFFGAIYHSANFDFLIYSLGISPEVTSQFNYAGKYAPLIIPINNLLEYLEDFSKFRKYFNSDTISAIRGEHSLSVLSQELMEEFHGLTPEGIREFILRIDELGHTASHPRYIFEWLNDIGVITAEEYDALWVEEILHREGITEKQLSKIYLTIYRQLESVRISGQNLTSTYEDVLVYIYYRLIEKNSADIRANQRYLTSEDNGGQFGHLLSVLGVEKALDAIWDDLAIFYPGIRIFTIQTP